MTALSACYFCGTAVDAPVREYDVVSESIVAADSPSASLCPTCRNKLARVLQEVADAIDADTASGIDLEPAAEVRPESQREAPASGNGGGVDVEDEQSDSERSDREAEPDRVDPAVEGTDGQDPDERPSAPGDDGDAGRSSGIAIDADNAFVGPTVSPPEEPDGVAVDGSDTTAGSDAAADSDAAGLSNATVVSNAAEGCGASTVSDESAADGRSGPEESDESTVERPDAETYNRVVRLLQNREFPVDRDAFEDLAASAYDIERQACRGVLDYAIERGELSESDGELRRPDA